MGSRSRFCGLAVLAGASVVLTSAGNSPAALPTSPHTPDDRIPDAYRGSVAALMFPGATRSFQVTSSGDLYNGVWSIRIEPGSGLLTASLPGRIAFEDRWCPVAHWERECGDTHWAFDAVAFPEPEPPFWSSRGAVARFVAAGQRRWDSEKEARSFAQVPGGKLTRLMLGVPQPVERTDLDRRNLFVALHAAVTNTGASTTEARIALRCEAAGREAPFRAPDHLLPSPWSHPWEPLDSDDSVLGFAEGTIRAGELVKRWHLRPGECFGFDAILPAYATPFRELARLACVPFEQRVQAARGYWSAETDRGAAFDVPDPELRAAVRAARVLLLAARERRDEDWVPLGNPFQYRDVWVRDGARAAEALAVSGYTRESRQLAKGLLRFQAPTGSVVSQVGQLDGTGQALWALEQTMLRPSPAPGLDRLAPAARRAWRSIEAQRALSGAGREGARAGMLPATDPHDCERVRGQLVGNDAWALVGYRATARLLRACGDSAAADTVERSRREYSRGFLDALSRAGCPDVPPSWQLAGIDWGNLNVGYPCEVLEAGDARLSRLALRYWRPVGGAGLGYYRNPDSLHSYVAIDLATVALLAGDRVAAERILDATLRWRSASGGAAEMFVGSTQDFGRNFPPHATAAAGLLSLVRNSLVFDDADTLALTLGARSGWWSGTTVRDAPTRWGRIDLRFSSTHERADWSWNAVPVWTLLTLPPGTRPREVVAPLRAARRPDQVLAPPGTTSARVALVRVGSS